MSRPPLRRQTRTLETSNCCSKGETPLPHGRSLISSRSLLISAATVSQRFSFCHLGRHVLIAEHWVPIVGRKKRCARIEERAPGIRHRRSNCHPSPGGT